MVCNTEHCIWRPRPPASGGVKHSKDRCSEYHLSLLVVLGFDAHLVVVLTPVSDFKGLAYLLPLDELLRLWEPQKWILGTIWGL